jgi:EmrB/QacA subfamily drug resistance transporter
LGDETTHFLNQKSAEHTDYSKKWYVMTSIAMGVFLASIDGSIVNIALPTLVKSFSTEFATVEWVVLAYLLTLTTLMLSVGRLADIVGKKKIYIAGLIIFTIGSLLCGLSGSIYSLIGFRVLQGIGSAFIMALGTAIVTEAFPDKERGRALGIIGMMVSIGIIAGPTIGGGLLSKFSWHWIFFVNIPIGIAGYFMVVKFVPLKIPETREKFDLIGSILLFVFMFCFSFSLSISQKNGFGNFWVLFLLILGLAGLISFVFVEKKAQFPLIELSLFSEGLFSTNLITGFITFVASAGTILLMPFYLGDVLKYEPSKIGLMMAILPIVMGITAPMAGNLSDKYGTRKLTVIGLSILTLGYYSISMLAVNTSIWGYVLRFIPVGLGMGLFQSPNNSAIMGTVPKNRLGIASGLLAVTRTMGQMTGISVLGAIWAFRVNFYAGGVGSVNSASALYQVKGLNDTIFITTLLVFFAFILSLWTLIKEN